jgi:hypothetical protein
MSVAREIPENTKARLELRGVDGNQTPPEAVHALLAVEELPTCVWEPACGPGAIVRELRQRGHVVYATDLINYNSPDQDEAGWDFLLERQLPIGAQAIITNPPYMHVEEFVEHASELCPLVYMLLRLGFIEGTKPRRRLILDGGQLAAFYPFADRLPMMHRAGWDGPRLAKSRMQFAWFKWDQTHSGPITLRRLWGRHVSNH